jgi:DNA-binding transcriptional MerR regulator
MAKKRRAMTIGEVAARSGLKPDALRYYERLGLIARPDRTDGGFRVYTPEIFERLYFVGQAQRSGLTLAEIRALLSADSWRGAAQCHQVQRVLQQKVSELDERLSEIRSVRHTLKRYLNQCERALAGSSDQDCPVVTRLKRSPRSRA